MPTIENGPWVEGVNSLIDPIRIGEGQYQWSFNTINRGGRIQTRPAFRVMGTTTSQNEPYGFTIFTPKDGIPMLMRAAGGGNFATYVYFLRYPFTGSWTKLKNIEFKPNSRVHFEAAVKASSTDPEGNVSRVDPRPILMMSDGNARTAYWDGLVSRHLDPSPFADKSETPVGSWMKWIGNRLWIFRGKKGYASNLLDPLKFTEQQNVSGGGFFVLPGDCTGLGTTPDYRTLLAFTDTTTTAFQAGITDRNLWPTTQDFQRVILPSIGCAAGRTIVNQYGLTWWLSHGGLMGLDSALQTYRTSKIHYRDQNMARSKMNLSKDISNACAVAYENFLLISVPSGDRYNYHTWVLDQGVVDTIDQITPPAWSSVWTGIRPVQWATGVINGELRCFALSNDIPPQGAFETSYGHVWEAFIDESKDIGFNAADQLTAKEIPCMVETRFMGDGKAFKEFEYAEVELDEASDMINIEILYAGRRSSYKSITPGNGKQIVATRASLHYGDVFEDSDLLECYIPQKRVIRSVNDDLSSDDPSPEVETPHTRNKDRSFSIMIKWSGKIAISKIRISFSDLGDTDQGACEDDEDTNRYIRPDGSGEILDSIPIYLTIDGLRRSRYLSTVTPRWSEEIHSSLT